MKYYKGLIYTGSTNEKGKLNYNKIIVLIIVAGKYSFMILCHKRSDSVVHSGQFAFLSTVLV